jgi:uncharacterized membrane protein
MPLALRSQPFHKGRVILFILLGLMALSVIILSEIPLFDPKNPAHKHLESVRWLLLPHALAAGIGLIIGPFQFSTYMRKNYLKLHRTLGKVYVICIYISVIFVLALTFRRLPVPAHLIRISIATCFEAGVWAITVTMGWLAARNRQIQVHQIWVARKYCITFSFFFSRVLNPIPAYFNLSADDFSYVLYMLTIIALVIPDIIMQWKVIFPPKKKKVA